MQEVVQKRKKMPRGKPNQCDIREANFTIPYGDLHKAAKRALKYELDEIGDDEEFDPSEQLYALASRMTYQIMRMMVGKCDFYSYRAQQVMKLSLQWLDDPKDKDGDDLRFSIRRRRWVLA